MIALLAAVPASAATPADRAATDSYLKARYEYERAVIAARPATTAALSVFAVALEGECRGVLDGVDERKERPAAGGRAAGEAARREEQRSAIQIELGSAEGGAADAVLQPLETAFAAAVSPLRWSDPRAAATVTRELREAPAERRAPSGPETCADMRSWAQSGFKQLAPGTREFEAQLQSAGEESSEGPSIDSLLRPYEGPAERTLIAKTERLGSEQSGTATVGTLLAELERLRVALGFKPFDGPRHTPTLIGRGRTASGATYTVSTEPTLVGKPLRCRAELAVEYQFQEHQNRGGIFGIGSGGPICAAGRAAQRRPALGCESGLLTIAQVMTRTVRTVQLRLADGRTLSSKVVSIPARDGGPATLYVQALRARAAKPITITELGAGGRVITTIRLPAHARCPTRAAEEPRTAQLARGTTPDGASFMIEGSYFGGPGHGSFSLNLSTGSTLQSQWEASQGRPPRGPFLPSFGGECPPHAWSVVYGVLKRPGGSVSAVTAEGEVLLTTAPIPARLHAGGVLAYGAFTQLPRRLIVRDAAGHEVADEHLAGQVTYNREFCEGYAEQ